MPHKPPKGFVIVGFEAGTERSHQEVTFDFVENRCQYESNERCAILQDEVNENRICWHNNFEACSIALCLQSRQSTVQYEARQSEIDLFKA